MGKCSIQQPDAADRDRHSVGDSGLWKLTYEYGELATIDGSVNTAKNTGNIALQTVSFNGLAQPFIQSYKYDSLYRLTEARETKNSSQTWKQTFGYDVYGNRNAFTQDVGGNQTSGTPAVNAATNRFTSTNFTYDTNGNITADIDPLTSTARQFKFNGDNKQVEVNAGSTNIGKYYYDGEGKRVKKVTQTETTIFVYSAGKLAEEYTTATPPSSPTINYTATDLLGSPRVLTDKWGNVTSRRDFMPFGEEIFADGQNRTTAGKYSVTGEDAVRKRFTGYEKDKETSLDFAEARYYQNLHGRFTAVDPLLSSGRSANPQTFNRYVYVTNNPLALTDPSGLQAATPERTGKWFRPIEPEGEWSASWVWDDDPQPDPANYRQKSFVELVFQVSGTDMWEAQNPTNGTKEQFASPKEAYDTLDRWTGGILNYLADKHLSKSDTSKDFGSWWGNLCAGSAMKFANRIEPPNNGQWAEAGISTRRLPIFNPHFIPKDLTKILQGATNKVSAELAANPALAKTVLTRAEYAAGQRAPYLANMQYGNAMQRLLARDVSKSIHKQLFQHVGGPGRPDFISRGINFDITTVKGISSHLARPGYGEGLQICTYQRPGSFTVFK